MKIKKLVKKVAKQKYNCSYTSRTISMGDFELGPMNFIKVSEQEEKDELAARLKKRKEKVGK